jgi:hypothetical protein
VVIDAAVDTQWIRGMIPDFEQRKQADGVVEPDDLAANYVALYDQPRNAWTFEMDVRPWSETWYGVSYEKDRRILLRFW